MTREEREDAIDIIQSILNNYEEDECLVTEITIGDEDIKAFKMAIKALEQEPSYNSVNSLVESKLKNPKAKSFDILHFVADNAGLSTFEAIEKAYIMGVSEQETVIDKIRAEIEQAAFKDVNGSKYIFVNRINQIVDKYKAESEDNENF